MIDLSKEVAYLQSKPIFNGVSEDGVTLMAALFRMTLDKMNKSDDSEGFTTLADLYEKGYIRVVSDEENDSMCVESCSPEDAPQLNIKFN